MNVRDAMREIKELSQQELRERFPVLKQAEERGLWAVFIKMHLEDPPYDRDCAALFWNTDGWWSWDGSTYDWTAELRNETADTQEMEQALRRRKKALELMQQQN